MVRTFTPGVTESYKRPLVLSQAHLSPDVHNLAPRHLCLQAHQPLACPHGSSEQRWVHAFSKWGHPSLVSGSIFFLDFPLLQKPFSSPVSVLWKWPQLGPKSFLSCLCSPWNPVTFRVFICWWNSKMFLSPHPRLSSTTLEMHEALSECGLLTWVGPCQKHQCLRPSGEAKPSPGKAWRGGKVFLWSKENCWWTIDQYVSKLLATSSSSGMTPEPTPLQGCLLETG